VGRSLLRGFAGSAADERGGMEVGRGMALHHRC
jgi:hypothetical protein